MLCILPNTRTLCSTQRVGFEAGVVERRNDFMTTERRFTDDEVAEILDRATETNTPGGTTPAVGSGLTLSELHDIGDEVGIPKDVITRAATSLDRAGPVVAPDRRFLGTRIGVGRTVYLDRPLSDSEWNRLVVDLRETFDARGKVRQEGAFRQWTNSNLQALVEPTESGERLRLKTVKGNGQVRLAVGASLFGVGSVLSTLSVLGAGVENIRSASMVAMVIGGAAIYLGTRLTLPTWARTREQQMEDVIERLSDSVGGADDSDEESARS